MISTTWPNMSKAIPMIILTLIVIFKPAFPDFDSITEIQAKGNVIKQYNKNHETFERVLAYLLGLDGDIFISLENKKSLRVTSFKSQDSSVIKIGDNQIEEDILSIIKELDYVYIIKIEKVIRFEKRSHVGFPQRVTYHGIAYFVSSYTPSNEDYAKLEKLNEDRYYYISVK